MNRFETNQNMPLCSICRLNRVENEGDVCSDCSLQPEISYPYSNNNKETDKTLKREAPNNTYTRFDSALTNVFPSNNEEEDEDEFEM